MLQDDLSSKPWHAPLQPSSRKSQKLGETKQKDRVKKGASGTMQRNNTNSATTKCEKESECAGLPRQLSRALSIVLPVVSRLVMKAACHCPSGGWAAAGGERCQARLTRAEIPLFGVCLRQKLRKQSPRHSTAITENSGTENHHVLLLKKQKGNRLNVQLHLFYLREEFLLTHDMEQMLSIFQEAALVAETFVLLILRKSAPKSD